MSAHADVRSIQSWLIWLKYALLPLLRVQYRSEIWLWGNYVASQIYLHQHYISEDGLDSGLILRKRGRVDILRYRNILLYVGGRVKPLPIHQALVLHA